MARDKPTAGNKPLPATSTVNGIPQHHSKTQKHHRPEMPPPTKSKTRLNLLNPVTLLMRRRSSQAVETTTDKPSAKNLIVPPMDLPPGYDPSIKGNRVHDFSAPKPKRNLSYNDALGAQFGPAYSHNSSPLEPIRQSPPDLSRAGSGEWVDQRRRSSQHIPVFTENFDIDERTEAAVHAEQLANSGFIARNSWQNQQQQQQQQPPLGSLPPFGRKSQQLDEQQVYAVLNKDNRFSDTTSLSSHSDASRSDVAHGLGLRLSSEPPISPETAPTIHSRPISHELHTAEKDSSPVINYSSSPPSSPPENTSPDLSDGQFLSVNQNLPRRSGGLRHLPSSASRFSFQIASMDSLAEEKLLEDKHKQRHSNQQMQPPVGIDEDEDEEDDDFFDEDAMYDHDEMEGLDEPEILGGNNVFQNTHNRSNPASTISTGVADFHFAETKPLMPLTGSPSVSPRPLQRSFAATTGHATGADHFNGTTDLTRSSPARKLVSPGMSAEPTSPRSVNSFYFDDGLIDSLDDFDQGPVDGDGNVFDEDQFDDPSFLKRPQPAKPAPEKPVEETTGSPYLPGRGSSTYNVDG